MGDLTDRIWAAVEPSIYLTKEEYLAGLEGWEITPHVIDGETIGAVLVKGTELHFVTWGKWGLRREDIRHYLNPILHKHGVVTTRTPVDSLRQQRFNRVLGFVETGRSEFFVYFSLRRDPFGRNF